MWKTKTAALGLLLAKSNVRQRQINRKWKSDQSLKKLKSTIDLRHKSLSRSKTLRRGSLIITEKTSFIQQQHLRNKVKSFAAPAIKVEESDEPMHVVSKTRELVAITNTTNKGREAASHYAKILKKSPVFEGLSNEELLKIVCKLSLTTFQPGEYLMREGSYGDTLLLIEAGKVQVTKLRHLTDDPNDLGEEVNLKILGVGSLLGEIALMTDGRRTASIYAISKVICLYMNRETFEQLVRDGHITSNMMKSTTEKNVAILELEALSKVSIFQDLCHKRILGVMGRQVFSDGETLIKQGDIGKF
jgi:CRP/FNR family cyclic AMP-dependent transcriptional regulator